MSTDLLDFRLAYLQFISRTWRDEEYFKQIFGQPAKKSIDLKQVFNEDYDPDPNGKPGPDSQYKYYCNWRADIRLFINRDVQFKPEETGGWIGPDDEFIINIPTWDQITTGIDDEQKAEALAAYYKIFPSFFGTEETEITPRPHLNFIEPDLGIGDGGQGDDFLTFGNVIMRTIALAWNNEQFCDELFKNDDSDKTCVLSKYLGFNNPWNFTIKFNNCPIEMPVDDSAAADNKKKKVDWKFVWICGKKAVSKHDLGTLGHWLESGRVKIPHNIINLNYPNKPGNAGSWPMALNTYNSTGPEYPFTCM